VIGGPKFPRPGVPDRIAIGRHSARAPRLSFQGIFAPLRDPANFAQLRVDPELGTVAWPNGADLDPGVLYGRITGKLVWQEHDIHLAR
jgi:hypothetical protein